MFSFDCDLPFVQILPLILLAWSRLCSEIQGTKFLSLFGLHLWHNTTCLSTFQMNIDVPQCSDLNMPMTIICKMKTVLESTCISDYCSCSLKRMQFNIKCHIHSSECSSSQSLESNIICAPQYAFPKLYIYILVIKTWILKRPVLYRLTWVKFFLKKSERRWRLEQETMGIWEYNIVRIW